MNDHHLEPVASPAQDHWLKRYYFSRAAFSLAWVAAVLTVGKQQPAAAACLFVLYPLWDAVANVADARRSGGLRKNPTQSGNAAASLLTAIAIALALRHGVHAALVVFGGWAALSGLLQLATGARRWKRNGAQWAMVLSGVQSALAGAHFIGRGLSATAYDVTVIAPYAAFGAFYFLVSALWLAATGMRRKQAAAEQGHCAVEEH